MRPYSASYREADYFFGFLTSIAALTAMLLVEREFKLLSFPAGTAAAFFLGTLLAAGIAPLRRILVFQRRKLEAVRLAARAAFVDLGVSRTHARTGVLIYISMFERVVEVVPDIGVEAAPLGADWNAAVTRLERSLAPSPDVDRFLDAMRALGPILGKALPHQADDENELPDEVQ
jgi:putative membrane protein